MMFSLGWIDWGIWGLISLVWGTADMGPRQGIDRHQMAQRRVLVSKTDKICACEVNFSAGKTKH
jgi:hypothetical protein